MFLVAGGGGGGRGDGGCGGGVQQRLLHALPALTRAQIQGHVQRDGDERGRYQPVTHPLGRDHAVPLVGIRVVVATLIASLLGQ